uniref:Uncharacterized protein n=1 Tax=Anopheles atroparvus TaxID=41427 RepID=A0A182J868_ANOAO
QQVALLEFSAFTRALLETARICKTPHTQPTQTPCTMKRPHRMKDHQRLTGSLSFRSTFAFGDVSCVEADSADITPVPDRPMPAEEFPPASAFGAGGGTGPDNTNENG